MYYIYHMGCNFLFSGSRETPNPDPKNYKILKWIPVGDMLIIMVEYPDSTNYEGKKVLVFKDIDYIELTKQKFIDPHFSDKTDGVYPIARFEPTKRGFKWAEKFCRIIQCKKNCAVAKEINSGSPAKSDGL